MNDEHVRSTSQSTEIITRRLRLRPWTLQDTDAAMQIFGSTDVSRWLTPALSRIESHDDIQSTLRTWIDDHPDDGHAQGRWAIERIDSAAVVGAVALLPLPPDNIDLEIGWQVAPDHWGQGFGAEAGHAVAHRAFDSGVSELFAVVRPGNRRGIATARRVGMEWAGETTKYYGLALQVYRLTKADLDLPAHYSDEGSSCDTERG